MTLSARLLLALCIAPLVVAQSQFSTDVLALSPLGFWPLNGTANDASTHGANGALNGVSFTNVFPPPVEAQAAVFDRSQSQFVSLSTAASSNFNFGSFHAFTAMAWVRTLGLRHMAIVNKADANNGWSLYISSKTGHVGVLFGVGGQLVLGVESTVAVNDGRWHLVAATYDGSGKASGVNFYVDGVGVAPAGGAIDLLGNGSILNSGPLTIGGASDGSDAFEGNMNDVAVFGAALTPAQILQLAGDGTASKAVLGQFAFGGGWYSAIFFSNTGSSSVSFPVNFTGDNGLPLNVPSISGSSTTVTLAPGASAVVEAPNVGTTINQGYVSAALPVGVTGYGVFRQSVPGATDQEAVVPLSFPGASSQTLVYDETNSTTAVAIVNPSIVATMITITVTDINGTVIGTSSPPLLLQPGAKTAVLLKSVPGLSAMAGKRGIAKFSVSSGAVVVLGLRATGLALTSIPAANSRQLSSFTGEPFF